jgi:hypothetical protein
MLDVAYNPMDTNPSISSFTDTTKGYIQGAFQDDPSVNGQLNTGKISNDSGRTFWGGMALTEYVPASNDTQVNSILELATANSNLTAFSVFNKANNMLLTEGNTVQQALPGGTISYFKLGSNARIAVQCDEDLANDLSGNATNQLVSWDYTDQKLIAYDSTIGALPVQVLSINPNSKIVQYNDITETLNYVDGPVAIIQLMNNSASITGNGDVVGPASTIDGTIPIQSGTTGKILKNSPSIYDSDSNLNLAAALYGDKYKLEIAPEEEEINLTVADIGKFKIYGGTTILNLDDSIPVGAKFIVFNANTDPLVLTPTGDATLAGNNTLYESDFYGLICTDDSEFLSFPLWVNNGALSLTPTAERIIGYDSSGLITNYTYAQVQAIAGNQFLSSTTVDAKTTGAVSLGVVPAGTKNFYPREIRVVPITTSGLTVPPQIGVGIVGAAYADIANANPVGGLTATGIAANIALNSTYSIVPGGTEIFANITIGASATTLDVRIDIIGDYY